MQVQTVLCIPGSWADWGAFRGAVVEHGLFAVAGQLSEPTSRQSLQLEVRGADERMRLAFEMASGGRLSHDELQRIARHQSVVYLAGEGGSPAHLAVFVDFARRLLAAGGLAVKVENAGVACEPAHWERMEPPMTPQSLLRAFVVVATADREAYSCGMPNLGFPDAAVDGLPEPAATALLHRFLLFLAEEKPEIRDGHEFAASPEAPRFSLWRESCKRFPEGDPFHNPFGVWRFEPMK